MNDKFIESDNYGRELLKEMVKQFHATNIEATEGEKYPTDLYFTLQDKNVVAEIKVRDIKYENWDTHLMEVAKFKSLMKDKEDYNKDIALYVCFFGEDVCYWYYSFDIKKYGIRETKHCNRTNAIYTGKRDKDCIMIPRIKGHKFIKENGLWIKQEN